MSSSETKPKNDSTAVPTPSRPRKPYVAPAIESEKVLEVVTLGTAGGPPKNPGHGC